MIFSEQDKRIMIKAAVRIGIAAQAQSCFQEQNYDFSLFIPLVRKVAA